MRVAVTGASGLVGHWIAAHLLDSGHEVVALGRRPSRHRTADFAPFHLGGNVPALNGCDVLVHAALDHVQGRYRGGEGTDPEGFVRRNLDGTILLFNAARSQGVGRLLFLSSRAVYGAYPAGTALHEDLRPRPDTLYGRVKYYTEQALAAMSGPGCEVASLRATGIFGPPVPGLTDKWRGLFDAFASGERVTPRAGTEVHALDVAAAVRLLSESDSAVWTGGVFNLSDFVLDRRDLLERYALESGVSGKLPDRADAAAVSAMTTARIRTLGWQPRGRAGLNAVVATLAQADRAGPAG